MKQIKTLYLYIVAILLMAFTACDDGNDFGSGYTASLEKASTLTPEPEPKPEPDPEPDKHTTATTSESGNTLTFDKPDKATSTITVTSNEEWAAASSDAAWCTVSPASGSNNSTVTVTVAENTTTNQRTATITITGKTSGDKMEIRVTQEGQTPGLSVSSESLEFKQTPDGSQTVQVTCNEGWTAESDADWCKVGNKTATSFTVTAEKNLSFSKRTATVTVTSDSGKTAKVQVTQQPNSIEREDYDDDEKKI